MVAPGRSVDEKQLRAFLHERIANYKVPKSFSFEKELPLLPVTKVDKQALRRRLDSMGEGG
jgi:non-ribosomal peptide synthetase component E (peptide arylation enzyme)